MAGDTLSHQQIARMIDISAVQAFNGEADIRELVQAAVSFGFGAVHVLPAWVSFARKLLAGASNIALGAPVGFPSGGNHTATKCAEAVQLVADGVDEMDIMINVGKLRSGDDMYVLDELSDVIHATRVPAKVILETHYLTRAEIERACDICVQAGAAFVKTSTGWADTGATVENVGWIAARVGGRVGIKAAGGIRDLDSLLEMYRLGARRFGINLYAAIEIVKACQHLPSGMVEVQP
ncbi:MAG: deoxyribose-phosphate aldolase [Anaerolineae bacterium]|nr:deoxyribose-phosphate aldolase [Anaerolineae bacterium]